MQLAEHGGRAGMRDAGLLDSALGKPRHLQTNGGSPPDAAALAASYSYGISRNHPLIDGNQRTGLVAAELFLRLNGMALQADDAACVLTMLAAAAGDISEEAFAAWLRDHSAAQAQKLDAFLASNALWVSESSYQKDRNPLAKSVACTLQSRTVFKMFSFFTRVVYFF